MAIRDIYHDDATIQHYVASGAWTNTTLDDFLPQHARERGDKIALIDRRWRVAMPDPVVSERVCAYVIRTPGTTLTFDAMIDLLKSKRTTVWKLQERLEIRDAFPMTPSGKIQKYVLRQDIAEILGQELLIH